MLRSPESAWKDGLGWGGLREAACVSMAVFLPVMLAAQLRFLAFMSPPVVGTRCSVGLGSLLCRLTLAVAVPSGARC